MNGAWRLAFLILVGASWNLSFAQNASLRDGDSDGIPDEFEQTLLERYVPTFLVSARECDTLTAEFQPGQSIPKIVARNGTIYGQAFPAQNPALSGSAVELHYYDLWSRDCGRGGHTLDAEHVSVLIWAGATDAPLLQWKALYWYAAAHEDTPCDASNGAKASAIHAEQSGAAVWISRGKHAAFLDSSLCGPGCGTDDCRNAIPMPRGKILNLGEIGSPLNGALWIQSEQWPLQQKMRSDFTPTLLSRLNGVDPDKADHVKGLPPPTKALILAGNSAFTGLDVGARETGGALFLAGRHSNRAVGTALTHSGRFFKRVFHFFSHQ